MAQSDPDLSTNQQALPPLSREALHRIERAEKDARESYDRDKRPYFPTSPDFSFFEGDVLRARERILEYVRLFAEEVLDAHLKEYLEVEPLALLRNPALLESVAKTVWVLADELWVGYSAVLFSEPGSRRVRYRIAMSDRTMDQHPELEPGRYPGEEQWADSWRRLTEPDSEMARLDARFTETITVAVADLIRQYQDKAASKLGIKLEPALQPEKPQDGQTLSDPANVQEPKPEAPEMTAGQTVTESDPMVAEPTAAPAIDKTEAASYGPAQAANRRGRRPNRERRDAIHNAISKHGDQWRDHLSEIFSELDSQEAVVGDFQSMRIELADESSKVSCWGDLDLAEGEQRKKIIDALRKYVR